jgi:hypothetical protein
MDIEFSPGARGQRSGAAARNLDGFRSGGSRMNGKRLCSMGHPTPQRGERARRTVKERAMGVLWLHSSVNLVEPRSIALAAALILRRLPKIKFRLAPPSPRRNRGGRWPPGISLRVRYSAFRGEQFRINHVRVI